MTICKNRRAIKKDGKFDPHAVAVANKAVPNCSTYAQRKQWMDADIEAGGGWECADAAGTKRKDIKVKCPPGAIEVTVSNKNTAIPITDAEVEVAGLDTKKTDAAGIATWEDVPPKTYQVKVQKDEHAPEPWVGQGEVRAGDKCTVKAQLTRKGLLYFSIYYTVSDNAFKKAADTWKTSLKLATDCTAEKCYMSTTVNSEQGFKKAWDRVRLKAIQGNYKVTEGRLYTHASVDGSNTGLEFRADPKDPLADGNVPGETTLRKSEIASLPVLPWQSSGVLWLFACNTGIERNGWSPAQAFANRQSVETYGTLGYAYFSEQYDKYDRFDWWGSDPLYLRAYKRSDNVSKGESSTGLAIPEKRFSPQ